jgi:alkanesulfonate monooxygenase SsuD/methylene tetrahydromethanopterin reductase-like flavin-dependent oxidoreductase (luciferase family)
MGVEYAARGKRFREALEILQFAWAGEPFSYDGEVFKLPEIVVRPQPVQRPGLPLWLGGASDPALRRAVRWRSPLFCGATDTFDRLGILISRYDEFRAAAGWDEPRQLIIPRLTVVAETTEEARRRAHPALAAMFGTYESFGSPGDFAGVLESWDLLDNLVIVGDPERCADQLARYEELGATDLMIQFALPTLNPDHATESQQRFAELAVAEQRS